MIPKEILDKVRLIELQTRSAVNELFAGEYHSVFRGRGMEFAEVREYQPGDDVRTIDWNVTARVGSPFVKVFDEERELTVMLVVDGSASGAFGSTHRMKGEVGVEISALLAFAAIKNNDRVGLLIFTDEVELFIPPRKGRKHVLRVIRELLYFRPTGRGTSVAGALEYLERVLHRRSVIFLISDFLDSHFTRPLRFLGRRHDLTAITLEDPRERVLPDVGFVNLQDAETGETMLVDTGSAQLRGRFEKRQTAAANRRSDALRRLGVDEIRIDTTQSYIEPLVQFFRTRAQRH
jgi:uncharacterized protein (DUF58 family)